MHCNQLTQKPICAHFQAFSNTSSLCKLMFFHFLSGGVKQTAKNFTSCWFWLGKMHQNGLSGSYLGLEACQIQWCRFQVSMISDSPKNQSFRLKVYILLILTGKNASKWLEWFIFRAWAMPNPMVQISSLYDKWFLKNQSFRQKVYILLILTGKNASKWLEWCIFKVWGMPNPMALVLSLYNKWFLKNQNLRRQVV